MTEYIIIDALLISYLCGVCMIVLYTACSLISKIYKHIKFKREHYVDRLNHMNDSINIIDKTMWDHSFATSNEFRKLNERMAIVEEKLNKKETKKNVKKKKRN